MKISQVKTNLQTIITNLYQLQTYRDNLTQDNLATESEKISICKKKIDSTLKSLESEQMVKVVKKLKQRKAKRIHRTKKIKAVKVAAKTSKNVVQVMTSYCANIPEQKQTNYSLKQKAKDAKKYLAILDSLEILHKLRNGGNSCKLSESPSSIRSIWKATAEITSKELQKPKSLEALWRQVFFGDSSKLTKPCGLKEFIQRRLVWDSYIVEENDPDGSCVPIGWVCPKESARSDWTQYRV